MYSDRCQNNKPNGPGVLILSEFAGASQSLSGAVRINPWNSEQMVQAINAALLMSPQERATKHEHNFAYVTSNTSDVWAKAFLDELSAGETTGNLTLRLTSDLTSFQMLLTLFTKPRRRSIWNCCTTSTATQRSASFSWTTTVHLLLLRLSPI